METLRSTRPFADTATSGGLYVAGRAFGLAPGSVPRDASAPGDRLRIRLIHTAGPWHAFTKVARRGWPRLSSRGQGGSGDMADPTLRRLRLREEATRARGYQRDLRNDVLAPEATEELRAAGRPR